MIEVTRPISETDSHWETSYVYTQRDIVLLLECNVFLLKMLAWFWLWLQIYISFQMVRSTLSCTQILFSRSWKSAEVSEYYRYLVNFIKQKLKSKLFPFLSVTFILLRVSKKNKCFEWNSENIEKKTYEKIFTSLLQQTFNFFLQNSEEFSANVRKIKKVLSGLRQFVITKSPLKMMEKDFYFSLKALFVLKIFKLLSRLFCHA